MRSAAVLVVGAGPGGLATAAALARRGVPALVLERSADVGASWRGHYDRLHLHTTRRLSGLPGMPIPRSAGRWVARDDLVRYLEDYARRHHLRVRTGVDVERVDPAPGGGWALRTASGETLTAPHVVVATGYNRHPRAPAWPGLDGFTGEVLHASRYRDARRFRGRDVLVVGAGNTGTEIAVDLADGGAARVRIAVRRPPHVVRRSHLGWAAQHTGIAVRHLPVPVVDRLARVIDRVEVPDLSAAGWQRPRTGLYSRAKEGAIPVQDVGLIAAVRSGRVEPVAAVERLEGPDVVLTDGSRVRCDVVVAATGWDPGLEALVGHLGVLDGRGLPVVHGARTAPGADGLWFTGFTNPLSGMLRELRLDAVRIARAIAARPVRPAR